MSDEYKVTDVKLVPQTAEEQAANEHIKGEVYIVDHTKIQTMEDVRLFLEVACFHFPDDDPNFLKAKRILKKAD